MTMRDRTALVTGLLVTALSLAVGSGAAQTTTGTIRGYVTTAEGVPVGAAEIVARNAETGVERRAASRSDGAYILPGLVPAPYDLSVRSIGMRPQARRVVVQIGATALVDFALEAGAVELEAITIAAEPVVETRTSEVATNVTQQQIASLPTTSRNFLDLATLAPGTTIEDDRLDGTNRRLRAGAQSADQINVFIDGVSYKNDLIQRLVALDTFAQVTKRPIPTSASRTTAGIWWG